MKESEEVLLARIDERVLYIHTKINEHLKCHEGFERRLVVLERWSWRWFGAVALLMFLMNLFGTHLRMILGW